MQVTKKKIVVGLSAVLLGIIGLLLFVKYNAVFTIKNQSGNNRSIPKISTSSDFATTVRFRNQNQLEARLEETRFWDSNNISIYNNLGAIQRRETIDNLHIVLSNKLQLLGRINSNNPDGSRYVYQSFGMMYDKTFKKLTITLHVDSKIIETESKEDLEKRFSGSLLSVVYDLTHPPLPEHKNFDDRLEGKKVFIKGFVENGENYFEIKL